MKGVPVFDQTSTRPADGFSIAALMAGVLGLGPIAFALGAVGLHRTAGGRAGGRGFAIAGMVLGGVQTAAASMVVAGITVALVTGANLDRLITEFGTTDGASPTTIDALTVGDCFSTGSDSGGEGTVDATVLRTGCSSAHDGEILDVVDLPDGEYPGAGYLQSVAEVRCSATAESAVEDADLDPNDYEYGYYYPVAENWADGSRLLQCTIHGWHGDLRGSVLEGDATVSP